MASVVERTRPGRKRNGSPVKKEPYSEVVEVTPELAQEFLDMGRPNRQIRWNNVKKFSGAMKRGEWRLTGQGIQFDTEDKMLDGQHRCYAIIDSGVTVPMFVTFNLDPDVMSTLDTGSKRGFKDLLYMKYGESSKAGTVAAAVRLLWFVEQQDGLFDTHGGLLLSPTIEQLEELYLERREDIHRSLKVCSRFSKHELKLPVTLAAILHYRFAEVNQEDADAFMEQVLSGEDLSEGDPILALRRYIFKSKEIQRFNQTDEKSMAAVFIKTFNAYRAGKEVKKIAWRATGRGKEEFPTILTDDQIV